jgi:hypothetical protein
MIIEIGHKLFDHHGEVGDVGLVDAGALREFTRRKRRIMHRAWP